jgi:C1A family cysteine protease/fibronectin type 3 domain-containing protein
MMFRDRRPIGFGGGFLSLISVFCILVTASLSYSAEIDEIREAIQINHAKWIAKENPISLLPQEERIKRLGAIEPVEALDVFAIPYEPFYTPLLLAATFDWRNNGGNYVTPVRNQGSCGSCWAFAATAALESKALITFDKPGTNLDLSEQIVVSCGGAGSCNGGSPGGASSFFVSTGTNLESCYPYTATDGNCGSACSNWQASTYKIDGWSYVSGGSAPTADALKNAIYINGPLITTFDVYTDFFSYHSGVYSYVSGGKAGGHAVLIVGWNDLDNAFIVKNSWGTGWGESGYFRIAYSELTGTTRFGRYSCAYGNALAPAGTDLVAPTPNPMTWATAPYQIGTNSIRMDATAASDSSLPISYYFDFVDSPTGGTGGLDSVWQLGNSYTNSGLQVNHQYGYRVKARDSVNNETGFSTPTRYGYTAIETPTALTFGTLTSNSIQVQSSNTSSGLSRGSSGLLIENTTNGTNSAWKQSNDFWTSSSLSPNTSYSFRGKARNGDGLETAYSPSVSKFTLANQPNAASYTNVTETCIRANWTANTNPIGTQYLCENTSVGSNSGWTTNTYWDNCSLSCGSSYGFRVKARNGEGVETGWTSLGSHSTLNCTSPPPPTNVSASDGTYLDRVEVTWAASPSAASYTVYRATSNSGTTKTSLGTTTGTFFNDTTAVANKTYYYWVKASNAYGTSRFSASNAGSRSDGTPPPPTNVSASDGTYLDRVEVTWVASPNAASYTVYRATSNSGATKTSLGTTTGTFFNDTTAVPKKTYSYWVKASNAYGTSSFSSSNAGFRSDGTPPPPTNVSASDGTYVDRVEVTWATSPNAASYTVYRATSNYSWATKTSLGTTTGTFFNDTKAIPKKTYYYWVKASNAYGTSGFSFYDPGHRP